MIKTDKILVFKNIKEQTKEELKKVLSVIKVDKKEILFHEKELVENVFFVESGKVSVYKINENGDRKVIFILKDGDMINEVLINDKNTIFGCEVFENSVIYKCLAQDLLKIMEKDFELSKNIFFHTQNVNRKLYRQIKNLTSSKLDKKLAIKLFRIAREFGIEQDEWIVINTSMSITYMAEMLGCKRESVSRAMKQLQSMNLVKNQGKKLYIKKNELEKYFKST